MKTMQVFDVQDCADSKLRVWMLRYLLNTAPYQHGNDSYIKIEVSDDPGNEDCFLHSNGFYGNSPEDIENLPKMRKWMEAEGLIYQDHPNDAVLIRVWW